MSKIVLQGLKIQTGRRYVKFTLGEQTKINDNFEQSIFEIIFSEGTKSSDIIDNQVELVFMKKLIETDYIKIEIPIINLNGLKLKKIVQGDYNFCQFIVDNVEEFTMDYKEDRCLILIPKKLSYDIEKYISLLKLNPYLEIVDYSELEKLNNYYNINFSKRSVVINSTNETVFNTNEKYENYLLGVERIQSSFRRQFTSLLKDYGVELVPYPISENVSQVNYIAYKITELGAQQSRWNADEETLRYAIKHKAVIDFDVSSPNLIMLSDFKNKYQNIDLITNFTTFYTKDKSGVNWLSSIKWGPINTDFEQDYSIDASGNNAFKATFQAELHYYIVYDELFYNINELIFDLASSDLNDQESTRESFSKILK
jgi:hypothetical protein